VLLTRTAVKAMGMKMLDEIRRFLIALSRQAQMFH